MAITGVMLLTQDATPGLVDSATPAMLFGGGLGLMAIGIFMLMNAKRAGGDARDLMEMMGWIIAVIGFFGVLWGLFGRG